MQKRTTAGSDQLEEKQRHTVRKGVQHSVAWSSRRSLSDVPDLCEAKNLDY
jgi:hypothetical protein